MAGYTDSAFRLLCRQHGADVVVSEFVHTTALYYNSKKSLELLRFDERERPYVVQIFGKIPEHFSASVKKIAQELQPDGIDINFGCPAKKVFNHGAGAALFLQPDVARSIIKSTVEATDLPVSLKLRISVKDASAVDFVKRIKDLPLAALTVHGRTYEQGFTGGINFDQVAAIKELVGDIPVLANGGIMKPEDAKEVLQRTRADGVALGRGTFGKPWIFEQIKSYFATGVYKEYTLEQVKEVARTHAWYLFATKQQHGLIELRKHLVNYFRGFPGASHVRQQLVRVATLEDVECILANYTLLGKQVSK